MDTHSNSSSIGSDSENDDKKDDMSSDASSKSKVQIIYELPQGTCLHLTCTTDPDMTTLAFKMELANVTYVPAEFISLIHWNNIMGDEMTLRGLGVRNNDSIVLHDLRLIYSPDSLK